MGLGGGIAYPITPDLGGTGVANDAASTLTISGAFGITFVVAAARQITISGTASISGTNTGDQTSVSGNAGTATALQTPRTINGVNFDGTAPITVTVPVSTGITGLGTGAATALAVNVGSAGAFAVLGGAGGTPSSIVLTNASGTAASLTAGTVTTNANLTGDVTSSGNATTLAAGSASNLNSGTLSAARMPALTGDLTTSAGAVATTLATVNVTTGTFGDATHYGTFTVNSKGLVTSSSQTVWPTFNQNTSGSAATLTTPRAINGVNFDGSAAITVTAAGSTLSDTVTYAKGGTGATSFTNHGVVVAGASALTTVTPGTSGNILTSNGTDWTSAAASAAGNSYQAISISAAGDTASTQAVANHSILYTLAAGSGTYTASVSLPVSGRTAGDCVFIHMSVAASANPTAEVRNNTSGGALLFTWTGDGSATELFVRLVYNGTAFEVQAAGFVQ